MLETAAKELFPLGKENFIEFDLEKTELIHFSKSRSPPTTPISLFQQEITPKPVVRWLGFFFDSRLSWKEHVNKKVQAAESALFLLKRLGNTQKGLSIRALRQLYLSCVVPIADYGSLLWWKQSSKSKQALLARFQMLQNKALRLILGAFKTSPTRAMEIEAAIPPPAIRLQKLSDNYALRVLKLQEAHPIKKALASYYEETLDELSLSPQDTQGNSFLTCLPLSPLATRQAPAATQQLPAATTATQQPQHPQWQHPVLPPTRQSSQLLTIVREGLGPLANSKKVEEVPVIPPWQPPISASFSVISGKKEALTAHSTSISSPQTQQKLAEKEVAIFYTDGSKEKDNSACSVCQIGPKGKLLSLKNWNLGGGLEIMDCELMAISLALECSSNAPIPLPTTVYSDSLSALQRLQKNSLSGGQNLVNRIKALCNQLPQVSLCWVPSHEGIFGNEIADKLAKKGLGRKKSPTLSFTSLACIARKQKEKRVQDWKAIWQEEKSGKHYLSVKKEQVSFSFSFPKGYFASPSSFLPKSLTSAYFQLLFGAGFFRSFSKKIKKDPEGRCFGNCNALQTPKHLLLFCPAYREERKQLLREIGNSPSIVPLFTTPSGRKALLSFLSKTKIATAKWLLREGA